MGLVSSTFDGRGYQGWKRLVLIALFAKNKLGFITGEHPSPAPTSTDLQPGSRCNDMVTSWILNSLSKEIADSVIYFRTAKELWMSLEHRFGQSNGAKLFHLKKELNRLVQGTNNIAGYFTKLKRLWDELASLDSQDKCTCVCICEGKQKMEKSVEDEMLIQFLMGLNDTYAQARGNILMMNPLPNINVAYSLILQDENQKETYMSPISNSDSSSFMVNSSANQNKNGKQFQKSNPAASGSGAKPNMGYPKMNNYQQGQQTPRYPRQNLRFKGKKKYNPNVSCDHCGKTVHVIDDCYRLIGFPEDFNFTNDKTCSTPVRGNGAIMEQDEPNYYIEQARLHMSKEQFAQFIQVMKQMKLPESAPKNAGPEINVNAVAGTILKYFRTCFSVFNFETWIIDSGAFEHMCFNSESFITLSTLRIPININLPYSHFITVTHIGSVQIFSDLTLHNVLYVPSFKYNLLSIHKFSNQYGYTVLFNSNNCMLQGH